MGAPAAQDRQIERLVLRRAVRRQWAWVAAAVLLAAIALVVVIVVSR
jgi:hypothetical protein